MRPRKLFCASVITRTRSAALACLLVAAAAGAAFAQSGVTWEPTTAFTDSLTPERRANLYGFELPPDYQREYLDHLKIYPTDKVDLPSNFSWVSLDGLTSVKDQGGCGSCWAFAAIGQIESHLKIFYGQDLNLSEQQMILCNSYGADCDGGWASAVYNVAMTYGAVHEEDIPYTEGTVSTCTQSAHLPFGFVTSWHYVSNNVTQIKTALLDGPVCSAFNADEPFPSYGTGCYTDNVGPYTNHLILIVGWDDRACGGTGGWICKNSWGPSFGEGGYFTIKYGVSLIGSSTTQIDLLVPPTSVTVLGPLDDRDYLAGETVDIAWTTSGAAAATVDIWASLDGYLDTKIADDVPNTGHYLWTLPNHSTTLLKFCVVPLGDTRRGFGVSPDRMRLLGHRTRYVSPTGGDVAPYESVATAARSLAAALVACTGRDTVLVAAGDYAERVAVTTPTTIIGGWNPAFTARNPAPGATRLQSIDSAMGFVGGLDGYAGVVGFEFHDCVGGISSVPFFGRHGGAIYINGSSPTIRDCVFTNNTANPFNGDGAGGAIIVVNGAPRIEGCVFQGNRADLGGAVALINADGAVLTGNQYLQNACMDSVAGHEGAGVYALDSRLDLIGETFTGNRRCAAGAALSASGSTVVARDVAAVGNRADAKGGAFHVVGGSLVVEGGLYDDNSARIDRGGAVNVAGADLDVRNAVFTGNAAAVLGATLAADSSPVVRIENTLLLDSAGTGFGCVFLTGVGSTVLRNCVVADNAHGGLAGSTASFVGDHNVLWNNPGGDYVGLTGGAHDILAEPGFCAAAAGDYALALHSPCLDRGDPDPACLDPDGSRADIGAYGGPGCTPVAPAAVAQLSLTQVALTGVALDWAPNAEPDVDHYVVYRLPDAATQPDAAHVAGVVAHPGHAFASAQSDGHFVVVAVDQDGHVGGYSATVTTGATAAGDAPRALAIADVVPNPFNPRTTIRFDVPRAGRVEVRIYDMRGRSVRTLADADLAAGRHEAVWDGRDEDGGAAAAGVYLLRVATGGEQRSAKLVLAK